MQEQNGDSWRKLRKPSTAQGMSTNDQVSEMEKTIRRKATDAAGAASVEACSLGLHKRADSKAIGDHGPYSGNASPQSSYQARNA